MVIRSHYCYFRYQTNLPVNCLLLEVESLFSRCDRVDNFFPIADIDVVYVALKYIQFDISGNVHEIFILRCLFSRHNPEISKALHIIVVNCLLSFFAHCGDRPRRDYQTCTLFRSDLLRNLGRNLVEKIVVLELVNHIADRLVPGRLSDGPTV